MISSSSKVLVLGGLFVTAVLLFLRLDTPRHADKTQDIQTNSVGSQEPHQLVSKASSANLPKHEHKGIRVRASDLTQPEKAEFATRFEKQYKPTIMNWCNAYAGHIPFALEALTPDKLVDRIGRDSSYNEYIFVVDGITLGVRDANGSVRVDYLNAPEQTGKMAVLPSGTQAPILNSPVSRDQIIQMIKTDTGGAIDEREVRMIPSGISGSMNGGVIVEVGGDPNNFASWNYNLIFGPDGNLAYYLRGQ